MKKSSMILLLFTFLLYQLAFSQNSDSSDALLRLYDILSEKFNTKEWKELSKAEESKTGLEVINPKEIKFVVENLTVEARNIGLTRRMIITKCELKSRQLGIEPITNDKDNLSIRPYLYINIGIGPSAFIINLQFWRTVLFFSGSTKYRIQAITWNKSTGGIHGNNSKFILDQIDELLEEFFNDFFKANPR